MRSYARPSFWRAYERLDEKTREAFELFEQNPDHPSLRFKKLGGSDRVWSVRVSAQYRAVGERRGDVISWMWIGTHNDFDKLFG